MQSIRLSLVLLISQILIYCCTETECANQSTLSVNPISNMTKNKGVDPLLYREYLQVFDKNIPINPNSAFNETKENKRNFLTVDAKDNDEIFSSITPEMFFFDANPVYREAIMEFKNMLMGLKNMRDIFETALGYRDKINLSLWLRGFIGSILNRNDGVHTHIPLVELKPDFMVSSRVMEEARAEARKLPNQRKTCVTVNDENAGTANGIENRLWYFREDLMVNSHHWYWHLEYPINTPIFLERAGELFHYMHHSMLSRYHAERLSNDLPPVVPLEVRQNGLVNEPYYSFLEDSNSGRMWANRPPKSRLKDVQREAFDTFFDVKISEHRRNGNRLTKAANTGIMITPNGMAPLNLLNIQGIDSFARTLEAVEKYSVNPNYYGDWHNKGHILISFINDPKNLQGLPEVGVMGDTATAMRDVVFYRWHQTVDNLFSLHKDTLPPYLPRGGDLQLTWPGISIEKIEVNSIGRKAVYPTNTFYTFWSERRFDLAKGLDFQRNSTILGSVDLCVDHLDHDEFTYSISVTKSPSLTGTSLANIRIFMAPRLDNNNQRYTMEEQRKLFFVLDTFTAYLKPGRNEIRQSSKSSSLTLEYAKSFRQLETDDLNDNPSCGCGWPHHLLIPKGKPSGMTFDLFVMVTNGEEDAVVQESPDNNSGTCSQGYLFCGAMNQKYPDSKPMGYPFDRKVYTVPDFDGRRPVANLEEYVKNIPNMKTVQVTVVHEQNRKEQAQT